MSKKKKVYSQFDRKSQADGQTLEFQEQPRTGHVMSTLSLSLHSAVEIIQSILRSLSIPVVLATTTFFVTG